jgi:hypothetical protein
MLCLKKVPRGVDDDLRPPPQRKNREEREERQDHTGSAIEEGAAGEKIGGDDAERDERIDMPDGSVGEYPVPVRERVIVKKTADGKQGDREERRERYEQRCISFIQSIHRSYPFAEILTSLSLEKRHLDTDETDFG